MKRGQNGFGVIETLLVLILLSILGFTGYYVYHTRNNANSTYNNAAASGSSQSSNSSAPSLGDAVSHTKAVYDAWEKGSTQGTKLHDNSQWANNPDNTIAALDLQLINQNKSWFTTDFVKQANNYETTNTTPKGFGFLVCQSGIAYFNNGSVVVTGNKVSGSTANVNVSYDLGSPQSDKKTTYHLAVVLKAVSGKWAIDSIDLSDCA